MAPYVKKKPDSHDKDVALPLVRGVKPVQDESLISDNSLLAPASCYQHRFDFEIGYLVKSPCRKCDHQSELPSCIDQCKTLDSIHTMLSKSVSCTKGV